MLAKLLVVLVLLGVAVPIKILLVRYTRLPTRVTVRPSVEQRDPARGHGVRRGLVVTASLLFSIVVAFVVGALLGGPIAGAVAALVWTMTEVIASSVLAIRDSIRYPTRRR